MDTRQCRNCGIDTMDGNVYCTLCGSENVGEKPPMNTIYSDQDEATTRQKLTLVLFAVVTLGLLFFVTAKYNGLL